jgi:aspartyl protease family protein
MFPSFGGAAAVLLPLALFCQFAHAESVALAGMMGSKALLVVDGGTPKPVGAGDTYQGVKVISTSGDQAVVEQGGKRITLRVGEAPVSSGGGGGSGKGSRIVLTANGNTRGYLIRLKSVRIGEVEVFDVEAVVSPASMPYVLLGNSFLGRFQMARDNDTMVLTRRY